MLTSTAADRPRGDPPHLDLLPKLLNAVFKWKWLIVATVFAVAIPVALVLFMRTPLYEVKMKILIKAARSQAALSLTSAAQTVFDAGGDAPDRELRDPAPEEPGSADPGHRRVRLQASRPRARRTRRSPGSELSRRCALRMQFNLVPDSNVIEVTLQDPDPRQAAALLNALATLYLKRHADLQAGGESTPEFFAARSPSTGRSSTRLGNALEKFQEKDNIINLEPRDGPEPRQADDRWRASSRTSRSRSRARPRKSRPWRSRSRSSRDEITKETRHMLNPEVTAMTTKLVDLQRQRDELLQRYQPAQPLREGQGPTRSTR